MKQVLLPILGTIAFIIAIGFLTKGNFLSPINSPSPSPTKQVVINSKTFNVLVADTEAKRSLGLGKRDSIGDGEGMFFVFPEKGVVHNFWMKDMKFAIDILWIADSKVVKIDKDVKPEPGVADPKLRIYSSGQPVDYVLEIASGSADKYNLTVGDSVQMRFDL